MARAGWIEWAKKEVDPRELPTYTLAEAAHYLRIPRSTLRAWVAGRPSGARTGSYRAGALIHPPDPRRGLLSFVNLAEAYILDAIRRYHRVPLQRIRPALHYLAERFGCRHPLVDQRFETDGADLFIQHCGQLLNVSQSGQMAMRNIVEAYLRRIEWDAAGVVARLYPFTRKRAPDEPRVVVIDPRIAFGRPALAGSGIPTAVIAERYKAGESIDQLADDYGRERLDIEEAIRCELEERAA